jgi:Asp-tRNA(Asn)/Glu-tRNA(Gln) amidotransferase A subunit family amidase
MPNSAPDGLCGLTAVQTVRFIRDGKLRPEEVMDARIDRIETLEPKVRAFAGFDPDQARARAASARPGPLQGIPIGVKDVLDTADMPSQYGSPIWTGWRPRADSAPVAWAKVAGAIVLGKTVTTD